MLVLTIRTDNPQAELGLYVDGNKLDYETWQADRELSNTIHTKIESLLKANNKQLKDVGAIVSYQGPGSFTGLRIGFSVANALADSLKVPIIASASGDWIDSGLQRIADGEDAKVALPKYGSDPHITKQKH